jgi:hypothetical protein
VPRFHFNIDDGTSSQDIEGIELPGIEAARRAAVRTACDVLREQPESFWIGGEWRMDVTDAQGLILFSLFFTATIAPALKH